QGLLKRYFFIDESGDPVFYGNRKKLLVGVEGFQPYLIIGMIETGNRRALREAVLDFMENIRKDVLCYVTWMDLKHTWLLQKRILPFLLESIIIVHQSSILTFYIIYLWTNCITKVVITVCICH